MGVVYYANYLTWFEVARTEHLRDRGIAYRDLEAKGFYMMVAEVSCSYKAPARYDDIVRIETWISEIKNSSLTYRYVLSIADKTIAAGSSVHVLTNTSYRPTRIPPDLREIISG